ncbi:MAG: type II toxin-antitoxin system VapC family toxin [Armatimonadetes bacterium]|nr:type II toxin-antitoxin system VapC family toxin [Armatimonadota bacterium]
MKGLLDTHTFLWFDAERARLSPAARAFCEDTSNTLLVSVASLWELQIKVNNGKITLRDPLAVIVRDQLQNGVTFLPVEAAHVSCRCSTKTPRAHLRERPNHYCNRYRGRRDAVVGGRRGGGVCARCERALVSADWRRTMSYVLEAVLASPDVFSPRPAWWNAETRLVSLPQNIVLLPLTEVLYDRWLADGISADNASIYAPELTRLPLAIGDALCELSKRGMVVYVEADYFGGVGDQCAVVWQGGVSVMFPARRTGNAINEALARLGVRAAPPLDSFDTVGLGRFRHTEDWVSVVEPETV